MHVKSPLHAISIIGINSNNGNDNKSNKFKNYIIQVQINFIAENKKRESKSKRCAKSTSRQFLMAPQLIKRKKKTEQKKATEESYKKRRKKKNCKKKNKIK